MFIQKSLHRVELQYLLLIFQVWLSLGLGAVLMSSTALNSQFCQSQPSRLQ